MFYHKIHKEQMFGYWIVIKRKEPDTVLAHHNVSGLLSNKHKTQDSDRKVEFVNTAKMLHGYYYIFRIKKSSISIKFKYFCLLFPVFYNLIYKTYVGHSPSGKALPFDGSISSVRIRYALLCKSTTQFACRTQHLLEGEVQVTKRFTIKSSINLHSLSTNGYIHHQFR